MNELELWRILTELLQGDINKDEAVKKISALELESKAEPTDLYFLDLADDDQWLIKNKDRNIRFKAGKDKQKVDDVIDKLNKLKPYAVEKIGDNIYACWDEKEKEERTNWEKII